MDFLLILSMVSEEGDLWWHQYEIVLKIDNETWAVFWAVTLSYVLIQTPYQLSLFTQRCLLCGLLEQLGQNLDGWKERETYILYLLLWISRHFSAVVDFFDTYICCGGRFRHRCELVLFIGGFELRCGSDLSLRNKVARVLSGLSGFFRWLVF